MTTELAPPPPLPPSTSSSTTAIDRSSLSNPHETLVKNINLTATVDFKKKIILATATYSIHIVSSSATHVRLDTSHLDIRSVSVNDIPTTEFTLDEVIANKSHLGSRLSIPLPSSQMDNATIVISYATTSAGTAVQWLPPEQTAGKDYPYLFTQCQAIHARSLIPCQDTPAVKMTYSASITVPSWAVALMSALPSDDTPTTTATPPAETRTYTFHQPIPIPSYLIALAVGHLQSHTISPRIKIYAEPSILPAAAHEFATAETMLTAAEHLTFSYPWGRYDLLCLPPSFPYGGMENPCLTFVTPTLLAGDRSLVSVVAHEMAHSWTGNLVTNGSWGDFWLNEGWTVFLERRIGARVLEVALRDGDGKMTEEEIAEAMRREFDFGALEGWNDLQVDVDRIPEEHSRLVLTLGDEDPDESYSSVPYEKGFQLIYALERIVGREAFGEFTKQYLQTFQRGHISSQQFKAFVTRHFQQDEAIQTFDWDTWFYKPGMPIIDYEFDTTMIKEAKDLAQAWMDYDDVSGTKTTTHSPPPATNIANWSCNLVTAFLDLLLARCEERKQPLRAPTIALLKKRYKMQDSQNAEILSRFCQLCLKSQDKLIVPVVLNFITSQGRMKYVRPLYRDLYKFKSAVALRVFKKNKEFYHPIAAKMLATDLGFVVKKPVAAEGASGETTTQQTSTNGVTTKVKARNDSQGEMKEGKLTVPKTKTIFRNYKWWYGLGAGVGVTTVALFLLRRNRMK